MDLHQREGGYPVPAGASEILGVEFSGVVAELGSDVTAFSIGEEVFGLVGGVSSAIFHRLSLRCLKTLGSVCGVCGGSVQDRHEEAEATFLRRGCQHPRELAYRYSFAVRHNCACLISTAAFQAMVKYGEVKQGENVLVHAGASGVGVAALQLARFYGA
jgi:NADPH:quinone reductase-like Zn-dependent oxidoreductase